MDTREGTELEYTVARSTALNSSLRARQIRFSSEYAAILSRSRKERGSRDNISQAHCTAVPRVLKEHANLLIKIVLSAHLLLIVLS